MFDPDLDRFKKKYDNGFDFQEATREILKHNPEEEWAEEERKKALKQRAARKKKS